jgi:hypothetical protein
MMNARQKVFTGIAVSVAIFGIAGGVAAAHTFGVPPSQMPAAPVPTAEPINGQDIPGQPDLPEPGDIPDAPGSG